VASPGDYDVERSVRRTALIRSVATVTVELVFVTWRVLVSVVAKCGLWGVMRNILSYASPLILFSSLFLTYLLPYLSFPLRIDPLHFQVGCRKR